MIAALKNIQDAVRVIMRLPGTSWLLTVTDEDGSGEDPLLSTLTVLVPSGQIDSVKRALGGDWENVTPQDDLPLFVRVEGHLEITLEEQAT